MEKEDYEKLVSLVLEMRVLESILSEATDILNKANKILREMLLKNGIT